MYQVSVAKRDFRDPKKIEKLWDFLNNNETSPVNCDAANGNLQIIKQQQRQRNGMEVNKRSCVSQIKVSCSNETDDKNLPRSKSMMCKNACNRQLPEDSLKCSRVNPHEERKSECFKFRISDFPTQIDRFVPRDKWQLLKQTTEYQDEFDRVATIILRHNIHNHSLCRNGQKCEHVIKSNVRRRRQL